MRCREISKSTGERCTRNAVTGATQCASHAGRTGAKAGNQNARKHGFYSRYLPSEERQAFDAAREVEGLDEEIALTRVLILRASQNAGVDPTAVAKLFGALCAELKLKRALDGSGRDTLADALGTVLEEAGRELGLG